MTWCRSLKEALLQPKKVTMLDLNLPRSKKLPAGVDTLLHLEQLYLGVGPTFALVDALTRLKSLKKLEVLSLSGGGLKQLPEEITGLALRTLKLGGSQAEALPENFGSMVTLGELVIAENKIAQLPASFGSLEALTTLRLEEPLTSLPASFSTLHSLERLTLQSTRLKAIPSLTKMQKLRELTIEDSPLEEAPEGLDSLPQLRSLVLHLEAPTLTTPWGMPRLESLQLSAKQLTSLPSWFSSLRELVFLDLEDTQLNSLPRELDVLPLRELRLPRRCFLAAEQESIQQRFPKAAVSFG